MILLDTNHGFISERYIVRLQEMSGGGWWVYYEAGGKLEGATAKSADVREFMDALKRGGR
jgi:hypothetical protein